MSPKPLKMQGNQVIGRTEIIGGNSPSTDSFGRWRTSEPAQVIENKNVLSKNDTLWNSTITGAIIVHGAVTGGPFQVGERIIGGTSGEKGTITVVGAGQVTYNTDCNDFEDGETITGQLSGATAAVTSSDTGADITFLPNESSVALGVGTVSGQMASRQYDIYASYVPGKSHQILETFVMNAAKANLRQRAGYFDAANGPGYELNELDPRFVIRTSTSGSMVDGFIEREDWNIDKLDGTGDATDRNGDKIVLDPSKIQILVIDFQWLGAGRVRFGFDIDGQTIYCHEALNANIIDKVYMSSPTLPVRYEIENIGATASASTLKEVCSVVTSEGGFELPGLEFSATNGITPRVTGTASTLPLIAIRLQQRFNGLLNRRIVRILKANNYVSGNDALLTLTHLHAPRYTLEHDTVTGGPFVAGEVITGDVTGATALIESVGVGELTYTETGGTGSFTIADTLTGSLSGATADVTFANIWNDTENDSAVEFSTNMKVFEGDHQHVIDAAYVPTGVGNKGLAAPLNISALNKHSVITQNEDSSNSDLFFVGVQSLTGAGAALGTQTWTEAE